MPRNFKESFVNRKEFKKAWDKYPSIDEIAEVIGITNGSVRALAVKYRKEGMDLPKKYRKVK